MASAAAPKALQAAGKSLWSAVTKKYDLRSDELIVLEAACRASDRVVAMEAERAGEIMTSGSMGQPIVHPLIAEVRAHEAQIAGLLAKLKLPDESSEGAVNQNRAAGQSRWAASHGRTA
jgi:hypothetical protein